MDTRQTTGEARPDGAAHPALQSARTELVNLDLIDIPQDSRPHSPEKLASLTEDLKDGQNQEIGVMRSGDRFELIFGKGRVLGMRALKAAKIRALVYETLTESQKLDLTFSENEEREDANPIYQAYLLQKMIKVSGLSQNKFAQSKGKTKGWVANYKSYLKMPEFVLQVFTAVNTSGANLRALKQLKQPELQIQVAQEVKEGKTKPEDVGKRCKELMGKHVSGQVHQFLAKEGISFKKNGSQLIVTAPYDRTRPFEEFVAKLTGAYVLWNHKNPYIPTDQEAADMAKRQEEQEAYAKVLAEREAYLAARQANPAPPPAATPPAPATPEKEEPLDPRIAAMIARRKAQRVLP